VTQNQDETCFHDLAHGGLCPAFDRGFLGGPFEGTRTRMFDGFFKGFFWIRSHLKWIDTELIDVILAILGFSLSVEASICIELNLGKL